MDIFEKLQKIGDELEKQGNLKEANIITLYMEKLFNLIESAPNDSKNSFHKSCNNLSGEMQKFAEQIKSQELSKISKNIKEAVNWRGWASRAGDWVQRNIGGIEELDPSYVGARVDKKHAARTLQFLQQMKNDLLSQTNAILQSVIQPSQFAPQQIATQPDYSGYAIPQQTTAAKKIYNNKKLAQVAQDPTAAQDYWATPTVPTGQQQSVMQSDNISAFQAFNAQIGEAIHNLQRLFTGAYTPAEQMDIKALSDILTYYQQGIQQSPETHIRFLENLFYNLQQYTPRNIEQAANIAPAQPQNMLNNMVQMLNQDPNNLAQSLNQINQYNPRIIQNLQQALGQLR